MRTALILPILACLGIPAIAAAQQAVDPRPSDPGAAIAFRRLSLVDEHGVIRPDGLMKARQHVDVMRAEAQKAKTAGISKTSWTWRGPGNIGGRTRALAINPSDPAIIFAGTAGGGIWKTTNAGASWSPVDDFMANLAVTALAYQPGSATTLFAGTGEGFFNEDAIRGAGIFTSTDGGTTWTQLASTATADFFYVNRLAFSADGSILLAATRAGLFKSVDGGASWSGPSIVPTNGMTDVKFLPGSNTLAVAAGFDGTAYYSTTGGTVWTPSSLALGGTRTRIELATSASTPNTVFAVADVANGTLYKSIDGGVSYGVISTPGHLAGWGWYANAIWVSPTSTTTIVVGGLDLWRSTDGGGTFTQISRWTEMHNADHHAIVHDPGYNGTTNARVYFASDGGVYKTDNLFDIHCCWTGWVPLNNNFGPTQFYSAAGHAGTARMTGGTQHNGSLYYSGGGTNWVDRSGSGGGFSAYDPSDANTYYGEKSYLRILRTPGSFSLAGDIWGFHDVQACRPAPYRIDDACDAAFLGSSSANIVAPFILDPNDSTGQTMLAGGLSLWRSRDVKTPIRGISPPYGPSWIAIKAPIGTTCESGACISAIAVTPGNSAIIYIGHNNGDIYKTTHGTDGTPTWSAVDSASMPNTQVQRIAVDPLNPNTVFAAFGGFTTTNFWKSLDGGATWTLAVGSGSTALPAAPVRGIAVHPTIPGYVYVGTEVGVFASEDGGATWGVQDGPANVSVDDLSWMGPTLIAATHGRGVYTATPGLALTTTSTAGASTTFSTAAQTIPLSATVTSGGGTVNGGTVTFTVRDGTNAVVGVPVSGSVSNGSASASYVLPGGTRAQTLTTTATYSGATAFEGSTGTAALVVGCPSIDIAPAAPPAARLGQPFSLTFSTSTVDDAVFSVSGVPPPGLTVHGATLSGSPTALGRFDVVTTATSAASGGCSATRTYTMRVMRPPSFVAGSGSGAIVKVFDSLGTPARSFIATDDPNFSGGVRVALGDLTGDGIADIISAPGPGAATSTVRVFDGGNGREVRRFDPYPSAAPGGLYVAAADLNGDGIADIVTGHDGAPGEVRAFDGRTSVLLADFIAYPAGGVRVAAGDVDADGFAEIITAPEGSTPPSVRVFSGNGTLRTAFHAYDPAFMGGVYVAAGDVDGDGRADIITGAGPGGGPHVRVFSGVDLHELHGFFAYTPLFTGGVRVAAGDLDLDGHAEILTAAGPGGGPHVRVWDGATGDEAIGMFAFDSAFSDGVFVAGPSAQSRVIIGTPQPNTTVGAMFLVGGWAMLAGATVDNGVDAVHVWALPVGGGAPIFVGATTDPVARPDVAAVYGGIYADAGFNVIGGPLPSGTYDLAAYAHSARSGTFIAYAIVRIVVP